MTTEGEAVWLEANVPLLSESLAGYLDRGVWPEVKDLQRQFDREDLDIDVQKAYQEMPRSLRGPTAYPAERIALRVRAFRHLVEAGPVLRVLIAAVQATVASYLSDGPEATVTNDDELVVAASGGDALLARRAVDILMSEEMTPLGGGGSSGVAGFSYIAGHNVRYYRGVSTLDDFLRVQRELLNLHVPPPMAPVLQTGLGYRFPTDDSALRFVMAEPEEGEEVPIPVAQNVGPYRLPVHEPDPIPAVEQTSVSLAYPLHPVLAGDPYELVTTGKPRLAMQEAWHCLRDLLYRQWPELYPQDGTDLASGAFAEKGGVVRVATVGVDENTRKNLQEGVHRLALSVATMLRNPAAHGRPGWAPSSLSDRDYGYGALALVNTACWWVQAAIDDGATGVEAGPPDHVDEEPS